MLHIFDSLIILIYLVSLQICLEVISTVETYLSRINLPINFLKVVDWHALLQQTKFGEKQFGKVNCFVNHSRSNTSCHSSKTLKTKNENYDDQISLYDRKPYLSF